MRFSFKQKICAALLSLCTMFLCSCSVTSILDPDDVYNMDHSDGETNNKPWLNTKNNIVYHDTYSTEGQRAFQYANCNEYTDITDFQYIGLWGDTFIYYYCVKKANGDMSYSIATNNFVGAAYANAVVREFDESETNLINCNFSLILKDLQPAGVTSTVKYLVNVGYSFFIITLTSDDARDYLISEVEEWTIEPTMQMMIRSQFTGTLASSFDIDMVVLDVAPLAVSGNYYCAAFVNVPKFGTEMPDNFVQEIILMQLQLNSSPAMDGSNTLVRTLSASIQEKDIQSTTAGSVLSTDADSKACIFIKSVDGTKITFGKCVQSLTGDPPVNTFFDVKKKISDKLITYSVVNDGDATNNTLLQLVYPNRLEYWRMGIDFTDASSFKYGATFIASYPLKDASSYWVSDGTPSITYDRSTETVILASNKHGVKLKMPVYTTDDVSDEVSEKVEEDIEPEFSAYLTEPYKDDYILMVGFEGLKFDRVTDYFDTDGNLIKSKESTEYYSLAQIPFATIKIRRMTMTVNKTIDENEKKLTVEIIGRLDTRTSPQLETEICDSVEGIETLVLDFAQLDYVSSAGLRTLLKIHKMMTNSQGEMIIINASETIKEVFELTGFIDILTLG